MENNDSTIGTLSLDYVTHEPIPEDAQAMTHEDLMHFLEHKVDMLRLLIAI